MSYIFKNNATSFLMTSINALDTTLIVNGADAEMFPGGEDNQIKPTDKVMITLEDRAAARIEICQLISRVGATFTISRAKEGTIAQPFLVDSIVGHRATAGIYTSFESAAADFNARYLGASDEPPTTDRNGNPLQEGAMYFDTSVDEMEMKVWNGTSWQTLADDSDPGMVRPPGGAAGDALVLAVVGTPPDTSLEPTWAPPEDVIAREAAEDAQDTADAAQTTADAAVKKAGDTMTGPLRIESAFAYFDMVGTGPSAWAVQRMVPSGGGLGGGLSVNPTGFATYDAINSDLSFNANCWSVKLSTGDFDTRGKTSAKMFGGNGGLWGGNGAILQTIWTYNELGFGWDSVKEMLQYTLNNLTTKSLVHLVNARDFEFLPTGGPLGISLKSLDNANTAQTIFVDVTSDERIKENIQPTKVDALHVVRSVPVSSFTYKAKAAGALKPAKDLAERMAHIAEAKPVDVPIGFVAQRIKGLIPEMVNINDQGPDHDPALPQDLHTVVHQMAVPYLVRAIQQLADKVERLEAQIGRMGPQRWQAGEPHG